MHHGLEQPRSGPGPAQSGASGAHLGGRALVGLQRARGFVLAAGRAQARKRKRTSAFRGVTKAGRKWRAALRLNNAKRELGTFDDELEAARCVRLSSGSAPDG